MLNLFKSSGSVAQCLSGEDNGQAEGQRPEVESRKAVLRLQRQMQAGFSSGAVFMLKFNSSGSVAQ